MAQDNHSVLLQYGRKGLPLDVRGLNATVLSPRYTPGLNDEHTAFIEAVRKPRGVPALRDTIQSGETVSVVIPDITRALPSDRLLPWLFDELSHVPRSDISIIVGTGTHRANTKEELCHMVGTHVVETVRTNQPRCAESLLNDASWPQLLWV